VFVSLKLTPHETVTVRVATPEVLEVEADYAPGGVSPPKHFHPAQAERFQGVEGELRVRIDGEERTLGPGDVLEIPAGAVHQMWNPGPDEAKVIWQTRPAGRTEEWFRAVDAANRAAGGRRPGPLTFAALLDEFGDTFRLAEGPDFVVQPLVGILGTVARLAGRAP
jgi:quercetin dioxygenase-like cupin family protein